MHGLNGELRRGHRERKPQYHGFGGPKVRQRLGPGNGERAALSNLVERDIVTGVAADGGLDHADNGPGRRLPANCWLQWLRDRPGR